MDLTYTLGRPSPPSGNQEMSALKVFLKGDLKWIKSTLRRTTSPPLNTSDFLKKKGRTPLRRKQKRCNRRVKFKKQIKGTFDSLTKSLHQKSAFKVLICPYPTPKYIAQN